MKGSKTGRPRRPVSRLRTERVVILLTPEEKREVVGPATDAKQTLAEYARDAVKASAEDWHERNGP